MLYIFNNFKILYNRPKYIFNVSRFYNQTNFKCKKCEHFINQEGISGFFCNNCSWPIEPGLVKNMDIFRLFKINPEYNVDKNLIGQTYKQYQFILHPDKHGDKTSVELDLITSNSSLVNKHYSTLLDDKKRAEYLFVMKYGNKLFEEIINNNEEDQLEYIMDAHEKVESISNEGDKTKMKLEFKKKIEDAVYKIGLGFKNDDPNFIIDNYKNLSFYSQIHDKLT